MAPGINGTLTTFISERSHVVRSPQHVYVFMKVTAGLNIKE